MQDKYRRMIRKYNVGLQSGGYVVLVESTTESSKEVQ